MMQDLDKLRKEIDIVDKDMMDLFIKRFEIITKIICYKKENNLPILDQSREDLILKKINDSFIDSALKPFYIEYMKSLLKISKEFQEMYLKKDN